MAKRSQDKVNPAAQAGASVMAKSSVGADSVGSDEPRGKKKEPSTEKKFKAFLEEEKKKRAGIRYERQVEVGRSPFLKRGRHKVDFVLHRRDKDGNEEDLYVEVKGLMTYYAVNVLQYLLEHSGKNFYIYQATDEDWIDRCVPNKVISSAKKKIEQNREAQKDEIRKFFNGEEGFSAADMAKKSMERLEKYKSVRARDVGYWVKVQEERDRKAIENERRKEAKKAENTKAQ